MPAPRERSATLRHRRIHQASGRQRTTRSDGSLLPIAHQNRTFELLYRVARSAIAIGLIEKISDIYADGVFERGEAAIIARALQPVDRRLRKVLITAANLHGHFDIFDVRAHAQRVVSRDNQVSKASRLAGADVEDAVDAPRRQ